MKKCAVWVLILFILSSFVSCSTANHNEKKDVPATVTTDAYSDLIPADMDASTVQTCYEYLDTLGYAYEKGSYASYRLGESNLSYVHCVNEDQKDLIDGNDYYIVFETVRMVVDADTNTVLGTIPYV